MSGDCCLASMSPAEVHHKPKMQLPIDIKFVYNASDCYICNRCGRNVSGKNRRAEATMDRTLSAQGCDAI